MSNFTATATISIDEYLKLKQRAELFVEVAKHLEGLKSEATPELDIRGFQSGTKYVIKEKGDIQRYNYIQCKLAFALDIVNSYYK